MRKVGKIGVFERGVSKEFFNEILKDSFNFFNKFFNESFNESLRNFQHLRGW